MAGVLRRTGVLPGVLRLAGVLRLGDMEECFPDQEGLTPSTVTL
jgi:hypothetical protein